MLGAICLFAAVACVLLVVFGGNGQVTIASFALAVISGVGAAVPLFRG